MGCRSAFEFRSPGPGREVLRKAPEVLKYYWKQIQLCLETWRHNVMIHAIIDLI